MTEKEQRLILAKEQEIKDKLAANNISEELYEELKSCGAIQYEIYEVDEETYKHPYRMSYTTMDKNSKKKKSIKICNPFYDPKNFVKHLINSISNISSISGAVESDNALALCLACFSFINNVIDAFSIDLTDDEAKVLISLLRYFRGKHRVIGVSDGFTAVNDELELYGYSPMDKMTYNRALDRLYKIHAIDLIDDTILILENVSPNATI